MILPLKSGQGKIHEWMDFKKCLTAWLTALHPQSVIVEVEAGEQVWFCVITQVKFGVKSIEPWQVCQ